MSYNSISSFFIKKYSFCVKKFSDCSYDCSNHVYLVSDTRDCFDFDKIKNKLNQQGIKSADSLFFPSKISEIQLIEFKDSTFSHVKDNVIEKAADSIYVFNENLKLGSITYGNEPIAFVLVISFYKNMSALQTKLMISGYTESNLSDAFRTNFNSMVRSLLKSKFPTIKYFYTKLIFVFSNNFTRYIDKLV